jgi:hypothetical protein
MRAHIPHLPGRRHDGAEQSRAARASHVVLDARSKNPLESLVSLLESIEEPGLRVARPAVVCCKVMALEWTPWSKRITPWRQAAVCTTARFEAGVPWFDTSTGPPTSMCRRAGSDERYRYHVRR